MSAPKILLGICLFTVLIISENVLAKECLAPHPIKELYFRISSDAEGKVFPYRVQFGSHIKNDLEIYLNNTHIKFNANEDESYLYAQDKTWVIKKWGIRAMRVGGFLTYRFSLGKEEIKNIKIKAQFYVYQRPAIIELSLDKNFKHSLLLFITDPFIYDKKKRYYQLDCTLTDLKGFFSGELQDSINGHIYKRPEEADMIIEASKFFNEIKNNLKKLSGKVGFCRLDLSPEKTPCIGWGEKKWKVFATGGAWKFNTAHNSFAIDLGEKPTLTKAIAVLGKSQKKDKAFSLCQRSYNKKKRIELWFSDDNKIYEKYTGEYGLRLGEQEGHKYVILLDGLQIASRYIKLHFLRHFPHSISISDLQKCIEVYGEKFTERKRAKTVVKIPDDPKIGTDLTAQVLSDKTDYFVWLENSTRKVLKDDKVSISKLNKTINISSAKNESESFQLVIRPKSAKNIKNIRVEFTDLEGENAQISKKNIRYNPIGYVWVGIPTDTSYSSENYPGFSQGQRGYWPDPLSPERAFDSKEARNYPIWVTVQVPENAQAGVYRGKIKVLTDNSQQAEFSLVLKIWDFSLPRKSHYKATAHCYRGQGKENDREAYSLCLKNGMNITKIWPSPEIKVNGEPFIASYTVESAFYKIEKGRSVIKGENVTIDTTEFDKSAEYFFDKLGGQCATFPATGTLGRADFRMSGTKGWKKYISTGADGIKIYQEYLRLMADHLRKKGWLDKMFFAVWDEPHHTEKSCEFVKEASKMVKDADSEIKLCLTTNLTKFMHSRLGDYVDFWCGFPHDPEVAKKVLKEGKEVWYYDNWSYWYIDYPAVTHRMVGWRMWESNVNGVLFWGTAYWPHDPDRDMWKFAPSFTYLSGGPAWKGRVLNGNGVLLYSNQNGGREGFVSNGLPAGSIRLEMLREGFEDYEYLCLLREEIEKARKAGSAKLKKQADEAEAMLHRTTKQIIPLLKRKKQQKGILRKVDIQFENEPSKYYEARKEVAHYIQLLKKSLKGN